MIFSIYRATGNTELASVSATSICPTYSQWPDIISLSILVLGQYIGGMETGNKKIRKITGLRRAARAGLILF